GGGRGGGRPPAAGNFSAAPASIQREGEPFNQSWGGPGMRANTSDPDLIVPHRDPRQRRGEWAGARDPDADPAVRVRNRLLRRLPARELETLVARAERVVLTPRPILHHSNMPMPDGDF